MKSTVKTVKGRGRPRGISNKKREAFELIEKNSRIADETIKRLGLNPVIDQLEKDLERKDHTLEIMRDEIRELEKYLADQKEKNAFLELDIGHLKDIIKRLVEHL